MAKKYKKMLRGSRGLIVEIAGEVIGNVLGEVLSKSTVMKKLTGSKKKGRRRKDRGD